MQFYDYLLRMGCAFLVGSLIGLERQCRQRNAGLRTNVLVAVGSAAFTLLSYSITVPGYGDPSRIAAQIVSGIGFLGGGLILKDGFNVRGLNTAATIWCSAAGGTLAGVGMYVEALVLVACVLIAHCLLRPLGHLVTNLTVPRSKYVVYGECREELAEKARRIILEALSFEVGNAVESLYYKEREDDCVAVYCEVILAANHTPILDVIVSRLHSQLNATNAGWERKEAAQEDF